MTVTDLLWVILATLFTGFAVTMVVLALWLKTIYETLGETNRLLRGLTDTMGRS